MSRPHYRGLCRMPRKERFLAARSHLHRFAIVRASQTRFVRDAVHYAGYVEAVTWGVEGSNDAIVLSPTGPEHAGLPTLSIDLTRILNILPEERTHDDTDDHTDDRPA